MRGRKLRSGGKGQKGGKRRKGSGRRLVERMTLRGGFLREREGRARRRRESGAKKTPQRQIVAHFFGMNWSRGPKMGQRRVAIQTLSTSDSEKYHQNATRRCNLGNIHPFIAVKNA